MKKQFFYAAFAIALMASCTSENEPVVEQPTPEAEDKVAIELGVKTPNIVGSRGTGTVGNVENETTGLSWNSQKLSIIMIDESTHDHAKEVNDGVEENIFKETLTFIAPKKDATDKNIRIYKNYTETNDNGTLQHKYYPVSGKYNFYGYHTDEATITQPTVTPTDQSVKVLGVTIDGTQDILAAGTIAIPSTAPSQNTDPGYEYLAQATASSFAGQWDDMASNQFSARTARNGFSPILDFKHQLARLKFYVKSGNVENGAIYHKVQTGGDNTPDDTSDDTFEYQKRNTSNVTYTDTKGESKTYNDLADGAIYITGITAEGLNDKIDIDLKTQTSTPNGTTTDDFELMSSPTDGTKELVALIPVAPMFPTNAANLGTNTTINQTGAPLDDQNNPINITYSAVTPIGESMMFLPNGATETNIVLSLDLVQNVIDTTDETNGNATTTKPKPMFAQILLDATKVVTATNPITYAQKFEAGKSYNVYITIYSLEEIKISAQLTDWKDGGDVDLDIENDVYTPSTTQP